MYLLTSALYQLSIHQIGGREDQGIAEVVEYAVDGLELMP